MRHLGARLGHIGHGEVHIVLPSRPEIAQQHGYIHAGATSAIADSAGGYAAFTLFAGHGEQRSLVAVGQQTLICRPPAIRAGATR